MKAILFATIILLSTPNVISSSINENINSEVAVRNPVEEYKKAKEKRRVDMLFLLGISILLYIGLDDKSNKKKK
jgi:hypothetical protein|tara:strand:+ start:214 stop:435 length:222 start_codon:yes stop_codon:yes gene_type:complete